MDKINIHRIPSQPIIRHGQPLKTTQSPKQSFLEHLNKAIQPAELKISKHATERLSGTKHSYIGCRMGTCYGKGERSENEGN